MLKTIHHSGMDFIAENTFHIETSNLFKSIGEKIKPVEFVRVKDDRLLFVEAKTSFPNPNNPDRDNYTKFQKAINEICEKFIHSLNMFASIEVGVAESGYSNDFIKPERVTLILLLVVKNHEAGWCTPIQSKLEEELPYHIVKIWKPRVYVINHDNAIKQGYVVNKKAEA